ncbi:uncharacterized protein N7482_003532 [Penicillium canariense]|uniref:Uncharacterized protein n=1 Tax=Penicillium canariense TaxID=189055 RepID=A0A9W9I6Y8_9EURO|nr:uncharacterized protein N7482_003532 [Penicillium canariense]KAJ5167938.1 hypothetical protein N7482_003532 [Penicillium canariense]
MSRVQQYWLPGYDDLSCLKGREGYLITGMPLTRDQIDDLAAMSREYERQEALRMTNQSTTSTSSNVGDGSSRQPSEPYINEIIPVDSNRARRRPVEPDSRIAR